MTRWGRTGWGIIALLALGTASTAAAQPETPRAAPTGASDGAPAGEDGEDAFFSLEVPPPESAYPGSALERLLVPRSVSPEMRARIKSVIRDAALPDTSKGPISVCFHDGTDALARRVADVARKWEITGTSVRFDFGTAASPRRCYNAPGAAIRISFSGRGTWSVVGRESRFASEATMNFDQGRDWMAAPDRDFARIVLHEFGHALGLYHEHQHPAAKCADEIDWTRAMTLYRGASYNQSEEVVRRNFEVLLTSFTAGEFDEKSIMIYDLPRSIFRRDLFAGGNKPACYFTYRPEAISDGDREALLKFYPADLKSVQDMRIAAFESYRSMVIGSNEADKALGVAAAFYPFADPDEARPYLDYGQKLMRLDRD